MYVQKWLCRVFFRLYLSTDVKFEAGLSVPLPVPDGGEGSVGFLTPFVHSFVEP